MLGPSASEQVQDGDGIASQPKYGINFVAFCLVCFTCIIFIVQTSKYCGAKGKPRTGTQANQMETLDNTSE